MRVFLGIGSNLEPESHIQLALSKLTAVFGDLEHSRRYRTPAMGFIGPSFINMVVALETTMPPEEVTATCQAIEKEIGRDRALESGSCSRCIDIDLLLFDLDKDEKRVVPEPRTDIRDFAYTAVPLADLIPHWRHEITGNIPLSEYIHAEQFTGQGVKVL